MVSERGADGLLRAVLAGLPWGKWTAAILVAGSFTNKRSWLRGKLLAGVPLSLLQPSRRWRLREAWCCPVASCAAGFDSCVLLEFLSRGRVMAISASPLLLMAEWRPSSATTWWLFYLHLGGPSFSAEGSSEASHQVVCHRCQRRCFYRRDRSYAAVEKVHEDLIAFLIFFLGFSV